MLLRNLMYSITDVITKVNLFIIAFIFLELLLLNQFVLVLQ